MYSIEKVGGNNVEDTVNNGIEKGIDKINKAGPECKKEDDCYFFQKCVGLEKGATGQCELETWALVVLIAGITAVVIGIIGGVCCCVKKICCCGGK